MYCKRNCKQTSKWLNERTYSQRNTALHAPCKLNLTLQSTLYFTIQCTLYYTMNRTLHSKSKCLYCTIQFTLYYTLNHTLYSKSKCLAELKNTFHTQLVHHCWNHFTVQYYIKSNTVLYSILKAVCCT